LCLRSPSARGTTTIGADGSVGGLGTRDSINSGPQLVGLQVMGRKAVAKIEAEAEMADVDEEMPKVEETEDQKAIRALLASATSEGDQEGPQIDNIPVPPVSEDDAYRQDVVELPDSATLEDYERIPVSQFGAALLRGMGWKEGTATSKKKKGLIEPWMPQARPALLGIGAKEKEVFDDGSKSKRYVGKPDKKYIPVVKKERSGDERPESRRRSPSSANHSGSGSRRQSRSPSPDRGSHRYRNNTGDHRDRDHRQRSDRKDRDSGSNRDRRSSDRIHDRDYTRQRDWDRDGRRDRSRDKYEGHRNDRRG